MFKQLLFLVIISFSLNAAATETNKDKVKSTLPSVSKSKEIDLRLYTLEHKLKIIAQSQLNYKIEKDLLKETYSSNYDRINIFIAIVLSIIGVIGFSGIRNINIIKKEYITELTELKSTKDTFDRQSNEFNIEKDKIYSDLKNISEENKIQNQQFKFLELKEKIQNLLEDENIILAIEYANTALNIHPTDSIILDSKAIALMRLNKFKEANEILQFSYENNPDSQSTLYDLTESYYFTGNTSKAKKLISENQDIFDDRQGGKLLELFYLFELFNESKLEKLIEKAKSYVTYENMGNKNKRMGKGWSLKETYCFIHFLKESELKTVLELLIHYWDEEISGKELLNSLQIDLPPAPKLDEIQDF
jgi:hypothetical protein